MSDSDSDNEGVSMLEVLEEENRLDEQARLVLGDTDDTRCTYPLGYVKRQPLYACMTCNPADTSSSEAGGLCLACSLHCHQGHNLVEMYTKRNFRCDCGNSRFDNNKCKLVPEKATTNVDNRYDHNFRGLYCVCDLPYPDPDEGDEQGDMLQCVVCEDWYHISHLDVPVPSDEDNFELVCARCVEEHRFLKHYEDTPVECDDHLRSNEADDEVVVCRMEVVERREGSVDGERRCVFLPDGWRESLCRCVKCLETYRDEGVAYLLDPEDGIRWYEEKGQQRGDNVSRYNLAMEKLAGMERFAMADAVEGYNELHENLKEYLKKFAENGKMVREEDIREFFEGLEKRKRKRFK